METYTDLLRLRQQVPDEVYDWIINVLGIPFDMNTSDPRPPWVDVHRMAVMWKQWDQEHCGNSESIEFYEMMVEEEWPSAA